VTYAPLASLIRLTSLFRGLAVNASEPLSAYEYFPKFEGTILTWSVGSTK
jgi:hypothetical protein